MNIQFAVFLLDVINCIASVNFCCVVANPADQQGTLQQKNITQLSSAGNFSLCMLTQAFCICFTLVCLFLYDSKISIMSLSKKNGSSRGFLFIKSEYKLIRIDLDEVLFFSGLRDYTQIYIKGKSSPLTTLQNLKEFESKLSEEDFVRVHRSYIVSLSRVDTIGRNELSIGQHTIPLGNSYKQSFDKAVGRHS